MSIKLKSLPCGSLNSRLSLKDLPALTKEKKHDTDIKQMNKMQMGIQFTKNKHTNKQTPQKDSKKEKVGGWKLYPQVRLERDFRGCSCVYSIPLWRPPIMPRNTGTRKGFQVSQRFIFLSVIEKQY